MEMHQIRYFLAVCDTLNFTRAAQRCHVAQPSLTQAIKKLEKELGGVLFLRNRGQTRLTPLGTLMRPILEQILAATQAAKMRAQHFTKLANTALRLGVMGTIGPLRLTSFLTCLHDICPGIEVWLQQGTEDMLLNHLLAEELDVVISAPLYNLGPRFALQPLYTESYMVVFPPGHRFEAYDTIRWQDLTGESYLDRLACERRDRVIAACQQSDVVFLACYHCDRDDWIQEMVQAGLGIACMPEDAIVAEGISKRPVVDPCLTRQVAAVLSAAQLQNPTMLVHNLLRAMVDWDWTRVSTSKA